MFTRGGKSGDAYLAFLSKLRAFGACSSRELYAIARCCTLVRRPSGATIVREDAPSHEFLIVASGSALISRAGIPEIVIGSGDWFGDVDLLSMSSSSATLTALTDVELLVMSRSEFSTLFETIGTFRSRVVRQLATRTRSLLDHAHPVRVNHCMTGAVWSNADRRSRAD